MISPPENRAVPFSAPLTEVTRNMSPSTSMSLAVTGIVMAVSSAVVTRSLNATGASLIGRMVMDSVAVEAVPLESTTR